MFALSKQWCSIKKIPFITNFITQVQNIDANV